MNHDDKTLGGELLGDFKKAIKLGLRELLKEGEKLIKQIQPMLNEKRSGLWAGFSEKDHRELQRLLGKLLDKLNK